MRVATSRKLVSREHYFPGATGREGSQCRRGGAQQGSGELPRKPSYHG
jgi:hypothetical protein